MKRALVALAIVATLGGCATMFAGGPDSIPINTNPAGAYVYVNGQIVGQTPMVLTLERDRGSADIRIYYPGFQPVQMLRYKSVNGWVFANLLILPLVFPVIIDLVTGNWQRFDDEPIMLGLTPGQAPAPYGMQPQQPQLPQQPPMAPAPR